MAVLALVLAAPAAAAPRISGGTPSERTALAAALDVVAPTRITAAVIGPPNAAGFAPPAGTVSLTFTGPGDFRTQWQASVTADAYNARAAAAATVVSLSGGQSALLGGWGPPQGPEAPAATRERVEFIRRQIEIAAMMTGVPYFVDVLTPRGVMADILFITSDPALFLRRGLSRVIDAVDQRRTLSGLYVEVVDALSGRRAEASAWTELGGGGLWVRRDVESCMSFVTGARPLGYQPPPCPVD